MRITSWVLAISMLKMPTGRPVSSATCSAMFIASDVLCVTT